MFRGFSWKCLTLGRLKRIARQTDYVNSVIQLSSNEQVLVFCQNNTSGGKNNDLLSSCS